ncbi:MAG: hypothetical protein ACRDA5_02340 [Clostridium sp.]
MDNVITMEELLENDEEKIKINKSICNQLKEIIKDDNAQFIGGLDSDSKASYLVMSNKGIVYIEVIFTVILDDVVIIAVRDIMDDKNK